MRASDESLPILDLLLPGLRDLVRGRTGPGLAWLFAAAFAIGGSWVLVPYLLTSGLHPRLIALEASDAFLLGVLPLGHVVFTAFVAIPVVLLPTICALVGRGDADTAERLVDDRAWTVDSPLAYVSAALLVVAVFLGSALLAPRLGFAVGLAGHLFGAMLAWRVLHHRRAVLGAAAAVWLAGWTGAAFPTEVRAWFVPSWKPIAVPVAEAAEASGHAALVLEDAELGRQLGFGQRYIRETATDGRMLIDYYLVPLVPEGWTEANPVPAWAVLITSQEDDIRSLTAMREHWKGRAPQGYVLRPPFASEMGDAFANGAEKGLVAAPGAPLVRLADDPGADLARRGRCAIAFLLALLLLLPLEPIAVGIARRKAERPCASLR